MLVKNRLGIWICSVITFSQFLRLLKRKLLLVQSLFVVGLLTNLTREGLKDIVKQKGSEFIKSWYFKSCDEFFSKSLIFFYQYSIWNEISLDICKLKYEPFQLVRVDDSFTIHVKFFPNINEIIDIILVYWHIQCIRLSEERIYYNCYNKVKENLNRYYYETVEVNICSCLWTARVCNHVVG